MYIKSVYIQLCTFNVFVVGGVLGTNRIPLNTLKLLDSQGCYTGSAKTEYH
jgi:hypothetical protein